MVDRWGNKLTCEEIPKSWDGKPATYIDIYKTERCRRCQEPVKGHP